MAVHIGERRVRLGHLTFSIHPVGELSFRVLDELEGTWSVARLERGDGAGLVVGYASSTWARRAVEAWLLGVESKDRAATVLPSQTAKVTAEWRELLRAIRRVNTTSQVTADLDASPDSTTTGSKK